MRVQVTGQQDFYRLAHRLHEAGQKGLKRELDKASRRAGDIVAAEVRSSTGTYIPRNFEHRFDTAFETQVQVRLVAGRRITVVFWARGKTVRRDIKAINAGRLRHPVFGRNRRLKDGSLKANPWVMQTIKPGLVDEPAARAMPAAVKEIHDAVSRVVAQIGKD